MATAAQEAEIKQQGAFEASRDPTNPVSAEDAELKAITESKKAGVQAYSFDPNATAEEKAAQAASHVPEGFHHQHKAKGYAIATDIEDGKPGAYDLPPPTTAGAIEPVKDKEGNLIQGQQEGDKEKWVDRTGWAPRFGNGEDPDAAVEESFLDHQTWVEGKLPDKFYGDWYHNTAIIIFACLASYFIAILGGGLAWVFLIMAGCGTYYRTSLRRVRRNFRDDVNREMAKTKSESDTESLEWMNNFMDKFWPIYAPVIADTVINSVDQVLSTATPAFLDSMRMRFFTLGSKPPRMEHVRSYPKAADDTVLMDWRFSFTPNDTADMTAKQIKNKINPKVILEIRIGKAMVSKAMDIIVEDFAFSGLMRVKMKLQIPFPHVERIEVCFLEEPIIDYVCKPVGGEYLGFDINFIPGLESFIKDQIHSNIGPIMYAPNVFPIEVAKMLAGSPVDQAIGVVAVTLHRAQGLKNTDKFAGTPDPYVACSLNMREILAQTKIIKENANPVWNETKYIIVTSLQDSLTLQTFDYNDIRKDKELGVATFPLEKLRDVPEYDNEQLEVMANGKPRGILATSIRFFPVLTGGKTEDGKDEPVPESNTGIARFAVSQAKDLDGTKSLIGQLSPYAILLLNNKEIFTSKKLKRTNNPIWDGCHKEILITDRKTAKLGLVIKDDRGLTTDPILGTYQIKLNDMLRLMEKGQEWYSLAGDKSGRAKMTLQWKPVALTGVGAGTGGYVTPIGVMRIHIKNARNIQNVETIGKSDPYARVLLSGIEKGRTVTHQNDLDPNFDEVIYVPMHNEREKLTVELLDQENLGKDRPLGQVEILASDYIFQGENGEYLVSGEKKPISKGLQLHGKSGFKGTLNYDVSFYPCLNIADPEDEEEEGEEKKKLHQRTASGVSATSGRKSIESQATNGSKDPIAKENAKTNGASNVNKDLASALAEGEQDQEDLDDEKKVPKIKLSPEELLQHDSGLVIFKLLEADLQETNVKVEVVVDDMLFPSFSSAQAKTKQLTFDEIGDCFIRELEFSRLTIQLSKKGDVRGDDDDDDRIVAKLTGNTMDTVKQCLNNPTVLKLKDDKGHVSSIKVSLKYIPVQMLLDPSESMNNMGTLRVDILDGADLPSADRNGYSDPFCKFELNGENVFKTQVQKKTLTPVWNEFFETEIPSRTAADFKCKVYDWDFAGDDDHLGNAKIDLSTIEPFRPQELRIPLDGKSGSVRVRLVFRPSYITRSRHGTSTFSNNFAVPGKIVTGVAGVPIKGVGMAASGIGAGVGRGASFLKHGFKSSKKDKHTSVASVIVEDTSANGASPAGVETIVTGGAINAAPSSDSLAPSHTRNKSVTAGSIYSTAGGAAPTGSATITIVSADGYPPSSNIMVVIRQLPKEKQIYKTKHIKAPGGSVKFDETFSAACSADTQFQLQVKDHATFGSDEVLGQTLFFVDESGTQQEKIVTAGSGHVIVKSNFVQREEVGSESPARGLRKSLLGKKENGRASREGTPA
ncbi:hypothetical protein V496_08078 [Pseudogymnoascus sp. VKM F-4515 (FW-2607)]|nr:hypothetical protein V496_08078 [Pseudogymnoascus sp. VKM F-4515 (FW-2607)]KFY76953.1 hypothetical protein V498_09458 [Pseudogymnoascus sp. VKM F-4517 (FW-2822)]